VSATYAYQEKPFDRIVRLSQPVDLRNARMDPWEDTTVKSVQIVAGKGVQSVPRETLFSGKWCPWVMLQSSLRMLAIWLTVWS
jgi:hypothetical protein